MLSSIEPYDLNQSVLWPTMIGVKNIGIDWFLPGITAPAGPKLAQSHQGADLVPNHGFYVRQPMVLIRIRSFKTRKLADAKVFFSRNNYIVHFSRARKKTFKEWV